MEEYRKKIVMVGDGACGKTWLLHKFIKNEFPDECQPTVFESYVTTIEVEKKRVELTIWDTAGVDGYEKVRPSFYPDTDIILLCFAIDSPDSLQNCVEKWHKEILHFCPNTPYILVGCKKDLRENPSTTSNLALSTRKPVLTHQGLNVAERIKASGYVECSVPTKEGVWEVFQTATTCILKKKKAKKFKLFSGMQKRRVVNQ